jgi:hypothetical protein
MGSICLNFYSSWECGVDLMQALETFTRMNIIMMQDLCQCVNKRPVIWALHTLRITNSYMLQKKPFESSWVRSMLVKLVLTHLTNGNCISY